MIFRSIFLFSLLFLFSGAHDPVPAATRPGGKDYALFFACEIYDNPGSWKPLPGLIAECEAIRNDLVERFGFSPASKVVKNPTLEDIYAELALWHKNKKMYDTDDQLLVFFSGHGQFLDNLQEGFFIPRDGKSSAAEGWQRNWYSLLQMPRHVDALGCPHILLAIDACYSGTIDRRVALKWEDEPWAEPSNDAEKRFNAFVHDRLANPSRILMTSGGKQRTKHPSDFVKWFREALATLGGTDRLVMPGEIEERWPTNLAERPLAGNFDGHTPGGTFLFVYQPKIVEKTPPPPDSDFDDDGVPDAQDKCKTEPGPAATKGCPDADGDGVADKFDLCKFEKGPPANDGCPMAIDDDADDDGIVDTQDKCPNESGPASTKGCPDSDGDGVADKFDQCETQKGPPENDGCPLPTDPLGLVLVRGGSFKMGCTTEQQDCEDDEKPVHEVTLSDFFIGKYEVTQQLWTDIMGDNPSNFKNCLQCPVENVSWEDVQVFLKKLNQKYPGQRYRLPTEAEWEYAARGGGKATLFGNGKNTADPKEINFDGDWEVKPYSVKGIDRAKTVPVGSLNNPNALGLHDMSGNVWEWCSDWYGESYYKNAPSADPTGPTSGSYRVLRGGSWDDYPRGCRVSGRNSSTPGYRYSHYGFRLAASRP